MWWLGSRPGAGLGLLQSLDQVEWDTSIYPIIWVACTTIKARYGMIILQEYCVKFIIG